MGRESSEPTATFSPAVTADRRTAVETKLNEIRAQLYRHGGGYNLEDITVLLQLSAELTALLKQRRPSSSGKPAGRRSFQGRTEAQEALGRSAAVTTET
jgi:hypothetical protein